MDKIRREIALADNEKLYEVFRSIQDGIIVSRELDTNNFIINIESLGIDIPLNEKQMHALVKCTSNSYKWRVRN